MSIRSLLCVPIGFALIAAASVAACSATTDGDIFLGAGGSSSDGATGSATGDATGTTNVTTTGSAGGADGIDPGGTGSMGGTDPSLDSDGDGWSAAKGDCNDGDAQMNPGAQDYPGNNIDEDCNGTVDDNPTACDSGLALASSDAVQGAKAMGICKLQKGDSWGLVSAAYVTADGKPLSQSGSQALGHGILSGFGPQVHPQEGAKLLALSSGTARQKGENGYKPVSGYDKGYTTDPPPGFPKETASCPTTGEPHDSAGLLVKIKTPTNAQSLRFNLNFYTFEFPAYICSKYNDFFVALLTPKPMGQPDGNISFDSQGNVISVNAGFLQVCHAQKAGQKDFACSLGPAQLSGTGFDVDNWEHPKNSAATGWLETTAAVTEPGKEISLLFTIWDSYDGVYDSTILLDNFNFDIKPAVTETTPVPVPK